MDAGSNDMIEIGGKCEVKEDEPRTGDPVRFLSPPIIGADLWRILSVDAADDGTKC